MTNFKSCIHIVGQSLEAIFFQTKSVAKQRILEIIDILGRIYQKIRPGRNYPRVSKKPRVKRTNKVKVSPEKERARSRKRQRAKAKKRQA